MIKKYSGTVITIILILFIWNTYSGVATRAEIIDRVFLLGLAILLIGSILYVVRTGFFDLFLSGFKQIKAIFLKQSHALIESNENSDLSGWKVTFMQHTIVISLGIGTGLLVTSTVWAFI